MSDLSENIRSGDATLVVFSPDAVRSGMTGPLEDELRKASGCVPVIRSWIAHTDESIEQFYAASIPGNVPTWYLVSRLFTSGPSLATIWSGPAAGRTIASLKGHSHPAVAAAGTIRSRYWCDNPVTNLIHVSDDPHEVLRELSVLRTAGATKFQEPLEGRLLPRVNAAPEAPAPNHCGILAVCRAVRAGFDAAGIVCEPFTWPTEGDAANTVRLASGWLTEVLNSLTGTLKVTIRKFVDGDISPGELSSELVRVVPLTSWDDLLVRAAAVARKGWCVHASK